MQHIFLSSINILMDIFQYYYYKFVLIYTVLSYWLKGIVFTSHKLYTTLVKGEKYHHISLHDIYIGRSLTLIDFFISSQFHIKTEDLTKQSNRMWKLFHFLCTQLKRNILIADNRDKVRGKIVGQTPIPK